MDYVKYPRTEHLLGSKFLDESHLNIHYKNNEEFDFPILKENQSFIIEEKMDGIGLGIFFVDDKIHIQQRGHIFNLSDIPDLLHNFKSWLQFNEELLYCIIGNQYTLFGEWLEYKHTVFYNHLPSLFLEYDMFDHKTQQFLSTNSRSELINNQILSVKVIKQTSSLSLSIISEILQDNPFSYFNNKNWQADFNQLVVQFPSITQDTLKKSSYEGFYIKIEDEHYTLQRMKWIRKEFFDIVSLNQHWKNKPIIKNLSLSSSSHTFKI